MAVTNINGLKANPYKATKTPMILQGPSRDPSMEGPLRFVTLDLS